MIRIFRAIIKVVALSAVLLFSCENSTGVPANDETANTAKTASGGDCSCDIECAGDTANPGICYYGICMKRASGRCIIEGSTDNCPPDTGCLSAPQCDGNDVCAPRFVESNCAGFENKYRLCSPGRGNESDSKCSACAAAYKCASAGTESNTHQTAYIIDVSAKQEERELCAGEEHWYRITAPAGSVVKAGIEYFQKRGDLDLLVYDSSLNFIGARVCSDTGGNCAAEPYPYASHREYETDAELFGFYDPAGEESYFFKVVGYSGAENRYRILTKLYPFTDSDNCTLNGFTEEECYGAGIDGTDLLPFPFSNTAGGAYFFQDEANYRFAARELLMYVRTAIFRTMAAFPGTAPLGVGMGGQADGRSPRYDISHDAPGKANHIHGRAMDIAYYQKDGDNRYREICGTAGWDDTLKCNPDAVNTHLIDLEREVFFIAQIIKSGLESGTAITVLADKTILPLLKKTANDLAALPQTDPRRIDYAIAEKLNDPLSMVLFDYPNHHHHIHIGLPWSPPKEDTTAPE